jgi:hypothetical protein
MRQIDELTATNPISHRKALRYAKALAAHERASVRGKNPPTRKAQAFIGRKIRRLAHEGMPAPRRVAAAYRLARRAGFKVPKRTRKNPRGISESRALEQVAKVLDGAKGYLQSLPSHYRPDKVWFAPYNAVIELVEKLRRQALSGVHENPTLAVLGNPPAKVVGTLSRRLYELRYQHAKDGKDYRHPFGPGATVNLLADGSVWITAKHRLWEDV